MQIMKRVLALFLILFLLSGCKATGDIRLTYVDKDIECEIAYALGDMNVRGIFKSAKSESGRDVEFSFLEPDALCGVKVKRVGNDISAELGGMEICADEFASLLGVEALFRGDGKILSSSVVKVGGESLDRIILACEEKDMLEIFLSGDKGEPVMIYGEVNGQRVEGKVIRFTAK